MNNPTNISSLKLLVCAGVSCLSWACTSAPGIINWGVTYLDVVNGTNVGFDDPVLGSTRQATFEAALDYVNTVVDESGTVDFEIKNSQTDASGFLASAGSLFFTAPNGFQNGLVFQHATTGTDPAAGNPDGSATFDFGYNWNSGLGAAGGSEFDLFTVSLHEVTHALGFSSLLNSDGVSRLPGAQTNPGVFTVYDSLLEDGDGQPLFGAGGSFIGDTNDLTSANVFFGGSSAVLAYGGEVPVYAPGTFASGSSISHITPSSAVMTYSIAPGVEKREYLAVEKGILEDIGWTLTVIPEPASVFMMGIAVVALLRVRRRR